MSNPLLITILERARHQPDTSGAMTMAELQQETGRGLATLRRELWLLKAEGLLEVTRVPTQRIDGVWTSTVAYRIVGAETDESAAI